MAGHMWVRDRHLSAGPSMDIDEAELGSVPSLGRLPRNHSYLWQELRCLP